jgi:hypothetical protein
MESISIFPSELSLVNGGVLRMIFFSFLSHMNPFFLRGISSAQLRKLYWAISFTFSRSRKSDESVEEVHPLKLHTNSTTTLMTSRAIQRHYITLHIQYSLHYRILLHLDFLKSKFSTLTNNNS